MKGVGVLVILLASIPAVFAWNLEIGNYKVTLANGRLGINKASNWSNANLSVDGAMLNKTYCPACVATERLDELGWPGNSSWAFEQHRFRDLPLTMKVKEKGVFGTLKWYVLGV